MGPLVALGISTAAGLVNSLFNKGGYQDTPENRRYLEYLRGELAKPESQLGYSPEEKATMLRQIDEALGEKTQEASASMARRGMMTAGQMSNLATDIGNSYGDAATDIELKSADAARRQKQFLISELGAASGRQQPRDPLNIDFGGLAESLAFQSGLNNTPKPQPGGFTSGNFMQGIGLKKRWNPLTGEWEG